MKKLFNYIWGICMILGSMCSCQQQDTEVYENDPRIFFARGDRGYGQQDSLVHSFFTVPEGQDRDTVFIELKTMGFPSEISRPVKIVQTNTDAADAAIPGTHYIAFDDPSIAGQFAVAPGEVAVKIPLILLRDKSLETRKVRLEMTVGTNEYFQPGIDMNRNFMVRTTAMSEKPTNWDTDWKYTFGDWGSKKMWLIVNYVGYSKFDESISDSGYKDYLKLKAHTKLAEYNQTHAEPLCENPDQHHQPGETCKDCVLFP